jgi:hypothetical protein
MDKMHVFPALIAPLGVEEFARDFWERAFFHNPRSNPHYYDFLIDLDDINNLILSRRGLDDYLRVVKDGAALPASEFTNTKKSDNNIFFNFDREKIYSQFGLGATIVIQKAERHVGSLASFCRRLERELQFGIQANLYITPGNSRGLAPHRDDHDVMILQVAGSKLWKLHGPPDAPATAPPPPPAELELRAGDLLYIPRGLVHEARARSDGSVHVTLGLHSFKYHDLLLEIAKSARDAPALGASLAVGPLGGDRGEGFAADAKSLIINHIQNINFDEFIDRIRGHFVEGRPPDPRGRLRDLLASGALGLDSRLTKNGSVSPVLAAGGKQVEIRFSGKTLQFPLFLKEALEVMLRDAVFAVRDIRGFISDAGRVELARTLVREGLLEIVDPG